MLCLLEATPPAWIERALGDVPTILIDHAHCEKKAASTAINLIFRYQDRVELMVPLSELAREELEHFERVLRILAEREIPFVPLEPAPYAGRLRKTVRREEPGRLVDTLICCAFIEARSCERMRLLAENLEDEQLARLYRGLLRSEARHHQIYVELARRYAPEAEIADRMAVIGERESAILRDPPRDPRLHN